MSGEKQTNHSFWRRSITALPGKFRQVIRRSRMRRFYAGILPQGGLFFDIGANEGSHSQLMLSLGAGVVAVEPQPQCVHKLRQRFGNRIALVAKGVDAVPGIKTLRLSPEHALSSFSEEHIRFIQESRWQSAVWDHTVQVEMTTLTELIAAYGVPDYIKLDVEGYEREAIRGLNRSVPCISFEYFAPEKTDDALECIYMLEKLCTAPVFNFSPRESGNWALSKWVTSDAIKQAMQTTAFQNSGFGEIFVRETESLSRV